MDFGFCAPPGLPYQKAESRRIPQRLQDGRAHTFSAACIAHITDTGYAEVHAATVTVTPRTRQCVPRPQLNPAKARPPLQRTRPPNGAIARCPHGHRIPKHPTPHYSHAGTRNAHKKRPQETPTQNARNAHRNPHARSSDSHAVEVDDLLSRAVDVHDARQVLCDALHVVHVIELLLQ